MNDVHTIDRNDGAPIAAEYVLGVLGTDQRHDFERRLLQEPTLRTDVEYWERRLSSLASEVKAIDPSPATWARIEAALKASVGAASISGGVWQSLSIWRWATIGSTALAAISLVALTHVDRTPVLGQSLAAKIDLSNGQAGFIAAIDPARNGLTIVPASVTNVNDHVLELWLIAPDDKPRSLGLIDAGRPVHINLAAELIRRIAANATLAVSIEPPGGSPTGQPTGPVIANGKLTDL